MNCNGYVVGNGQNRSGDILKFFLKGSDEDYCCGWYCDHNSNSCVSSWTSTDYTYRNDPKNQWNQFQLNWSGSYRGKIKVRWGIIMQVHKRPMVMVNGWALFMITPTLPHIWGT